MKKIMTLVSFLLLSTSSFAALSFTQTFSVDIVRTYSEPSEKKFDAVRSFDTSGGRIPGMIKCGYPESFIEVNTTTIKLNNDECIKVMDLMLFRSKENPLTLTFEKSDEGQLKLVNANSKL